MYIPNHFREADPARLFDFIERHSFAVLVSPTDETLEASHVPLLLDRQAGPQGTLFGHFARANSHWQQARGETLALFSGPHAYISPTWYEAAHVVPTWNYVAVHAYGRLEIVDDRERLLTTLQQTVDLYERAMPRPWSFDPSDDFIHKLAGQVVGFRIEITRLEGKWKLSQNHPVERREKVARALSEGDESAREIAALMRASLVSQKEEEMTSTRSGERPL
jgi:transcriptional regulator